MLSFIHQETPIATTLAVADLNGDQRPDLVQIDSANPSGVAWFWSQNINDQRELIRHPGRHALGYTPTGVAAEDVDGDGDLDLVMIGNEIQWFENLDGLGAFGEARFIAGEPRTLFAFGDVDSDGDQDFIVIGFLESIQQVEIAWHANLDGKGDFAPAEFIAELGHPGLTTPKDLAVGDIDNDDDVDIVAVLHFEEGRRSQIQAFANDGAGSFDPPKQIEVARECNFTCSPLSISIGDVDGDNDVDIVVLDRRGVAWNENTDGAGNFGPSQSIPGNISASSGEIQLADLDADGDSDLVTGVSDLGGVLTWSENIDGRFSQPRVISTECADPFWLVDLDQDGDIDVQTVHGDWFASIADGTTDLLGDLNLDGTVAFDDFLILATNFGRIVDDSEIGGDLNSDGIINLHDFLLLAENFGKTVATSS